MYGILGTEDAPPASFLTEPASPTWLLFCGRGSAAAHGCSTATPDADADGHRAFTDCDDLDNTIHPGGIDPDAGVWWLPGDLDLNCDGWPADFWLRPPAMYP